MVDLRERDCWIFDMDGTLTVAVHDFEAIRVSLGLPPGEPILEALSRLPEPEAAAAYERLDQIELELAQQARPGEGAQALLTLLDGRDTKVGIVTRNAVDIAHETLRVCGLSQYFDPSCILGRESGQPKPSPDGVHKLLARWNAKSDRAVMVGDYYFDLAAGRAAGTATVYLDPRGEFEWADYADISIERLDMLVALLD